MIDRRGARDGRVAYADAFRVRVLQCTVAAVTLSWSLNFVSFLEVKEAALWAGVVLLWIANTVAGRGHLAGLRALAPCWITLAGVVFLGCCVAPVPAFALYEGLRVLPLLLLATFSFDLLQHPVHRVQVLRAICGAGVCAALLALLQGAGGLPGIFPRFAYYDQNLYSVFGNEGLLAGFLAIGLACLPGAVGPGKSGGTDWRGRLAPVAAAGVLAAVLLLTESRGGLAAALAGLCGLFALRAVPARALAVGVVGFVLLGAAFYFSLGLAPWDKWLGLWGGGDTGGNLRRWVARASLALLEEHPVAGCGLGNYARAIPLWLGACAPEGGAGANTLTTYHAHLDLLEWIGETGLAGLLGVVWMLSRLRLRFPATLCGLVAAFVFSLAHPAFYSAPHALAALLLYAMNVEPGPPPLGAASPRTFLRLTRAVPLVLAVGGSAVFVATDFYPSFLLCRAEDRHLAGEEAAEDYERAIRAWGFHPDAHESYGIYCYERGRFTAALHQFHLARQGMDTGRIYQLLAMTSAALGDGAGACHWYGECAARWPWEGRIQAQRTACCGGQANAP